MSTYRQEHSCSVLAPCRAPLCANLVFVFVFVFVWSLVGVRGVSVGAEALPVVTQMMTVMQTNITRAVNEMKAQKWMLQDMVSALLGLKEHTAVRCDPGAQASCQCVD